MLQEKNITRQEQVDMYMDCEKIVLINMLIEANKHLKAINYNCCCVEFKTVELDPETAKSLNDFCNKQGKKEMSYPTK